MLALRTGWTPEVIGAIDNEFREAAHWALWAEAMEPVLGDLQTVLAASDKGLSNTDKAKIASAKLTATRDLALYRSWLYPEDPTDG